MSDRGFDNFRFNDRLPDINLIFYENEIAEENGRGGGDRYIALEKLMATELELDEVTAEKRLHASKFVEEIRTIRQLPFTEEDRHRLEVEMYTLAPLLLLWRQIRTLRPTDQAQEWLETAVKLALSKSGNHQTDSCEDGAVTRHYCDLSARCPARTTLGILSERALETTEEDLEAFLRKEDQIELVRKELQLASEYGLISDGKAFEWFRRYELKKQGRIAKAEEEFGE